MNSHNSFVQHHHGLIRWSYHCFDRILCNARIPTFLFMGAVASFLRKRRQAQILSPAFFRQISSDYHAWVEEQAQRANIPLVEAPADPRIRRHDWVQPYFAQLGQRTGTALILKAREPARVVVSYPKRNCHLETATRFVNLYYFYLRDPDCGRLFLRLAPYFPFNAQLCINGHEWLAQQLAREGIACGKDDNAFLNCVHPQRLQELADRFGAAAINQALDRALEQWLPYFTPEERQQGYRHQAFVAQVEYCDNLIFHGRAAAQQLFERLLDLNRNIGRPDRLAIVFGRPCYRPDTRTGQSQVAITRLRTPVLRSQFKSTSLKQYVKNNVLLRTETASYQLPDLRLRKSVQYLDEVRQALHAGNQRFLDVQQDVLASFIDRGQWQRLRQATVSPTGRRTPGLRLDDLRLLALWQALIAFVHLIGRGTFRTRHLLPDVQRLLNRPDYQLSQLRYDLGKLRCKGLVERLPHTRDYRLTPEAYRLAVVVTKIYHRLLAPVTAAILEPVAGDNLLLQSRQSRLDRLYHQLDNHLNRLAQAAGLAA